MEGFDSFKSSGNKKDSLNAVLYERYCKIVTPAVQNANFDNRYCKIGQKLPILNIISAAQFLRQSLSYNSVAWVDNKPIYFKSWTAKGIPNVI